MDGSSVISSKLTAPILSNILRRDHLIESLDSSQAPLIWISAPGGAGKTTLIADFVQHKKTTNIWLKLDHSDCSPGAFFHHLSLAAKRAFSDDNLNLPKFTLEYSLGPDTFSDNFFNTLATHAPENKTLLVLDDYHELSSESPVHRLVSRFAERLPEHFKIIVVSRETPTPEFVTVKARGNMYRLDWQDIKFYRRETRQFLKQEYTDNVNSELIDIILEETAGWAAGIRLISSNLILSANTFPSGTSSNLSKYLNQDSFQFFAKEVFYSLSSDTKTLLLKTSFMPFFTEGMAQKITGLNNSAKLIDTLKRSNLFIESHPGANETYSFHPLFKKYLNNVFAATYSPQELAETLSQSAQLLVDQVAYEAAIELYIDTRRFSDAKQLITINARHFIDQGLIQQLTRWLDCIPDEFINGDPDTLLLIGKIQLIASPVHACTMIRRAINAYTEAEQIEQAILAYGDYFEALAISGTGYDLLETCLEELEELLLRCKSDITPLCESLACVVLFATSFRTLNHPLQERWKAAAKAALEHCDDPVALLRRCNNMMIYYRFAGEDRSTYHLLNILQPIRQQLESIPVLKLQTQLIDAFQYGYVLGSGKKAIEVCRNSLEEGHKSGIRLYEFWFRYILILSLLRDDEFALADNEIKLLMDQYTQMPDVRRADILFLSGVSALYKADLFKAKHDLGKANELYRTSGATYPVHWSNIVLAFACHELGELDQARSILTELSDSQWLGSNYLKYQALCVEAWLEYSNENDRSSDKLTDAFELAHRQNFIFIPTIGKKLFTCLCEKALLNGIEADYVKKTIKEHNLLPVSPSLYAHLWPYSIRIHTLDSFQVVAAAGDLEESITLQQKPLELLKFIISYGGKNISFDFIADNLWRDADGDAAYKSLKTTLYRLRKSLGDDQYIITRNNTLSLSEDCWVDALAFWESPADIDSCNVQSAQVLADTFKQPFLYEYHGEAWIDSARERINRNFNRLLEKIAHYLIALEAHAEAIPYFEKALELDPTEEDHYIGLMQCYHLMRRTDRVASVFSRYSNSVETLLNRVPSARMVKVRDYYLREL
ncbi:BTAD domain-containing putative transcriptional regulator [Marinobacterium mangrovicola]|uniref:Transcriptional regulator n=1 Tax=Marinobacterium mangrovicola TaxID=1476959 RepID=A0A4R1GMT9_9GAMM|nr:BTAD domain-containing putative transcriptional regulator [Marinobacterium mangrovicola]TCK07609.1 transcriptional regulator [Marinobacterium mangrovicola]